VNIHFHENVRSRWPASARHHDARATGNGGNVAGVNYFFRRANLIVAGQAGLGRATLRLT
jgi:hypothetical protein